MTITLTMHYEDFSRRYTLDLLVFPPDQTKEEQRISQWEKSFSRAEENQDSKEVALPASLQGNPLTYYEKKWNPGFQLGLIFFLAAAVLLIYLKIQPGRQLEERRRQLETDYPEVITRFVVYIRSGMSIQGAWKRMAKDYLIRKKEGESSRYVYEEMLLASYRLESGISEEAVYGDFGRQCGLHCYLRFSSLLEQNVRKGGSELLRLLELEAGDALEEQKNLARKLAEEAETKMLVPMSMMLGIVLVVIIVPTFSGLSF